MRCTNGAEIWWGAVDRRCRVTSMGTQKWKILCYVILEYKRPAEGYPLNDFYEIFSVCGELHERSSIKIWADLLKWFWNYRVKFRGFYFPPNFQLPLVAKLYVKCEQVKFGGAWTSHAAGGRGGQKGLKYLSFFLCHAFKAQSLWMSVRHQGVGVYTCIWYRWIGEGL